MGKAVNFALTVSLLLFAAPAFANITDQLNTIRRSGCNDKAGVNSPLRASRDLNAVAREWSKGGRLADVLEQMEYRVARSASMRVSGSNNKNAIANLLKQNYCNTIVDVAFKEVGVYQRGDALWIVVAVPFVMPRAKDAAKVRDEVLALVNDARSKSRRCGQRSFDAVPPLKLSAMLNHAALIHSQDMSRKNFFEHEGSDQSKVGNRVSRVGYQWRAVGENIAAGAENAEVVVRGWLDSPGHCSNIMGAQYTEMGIAYVTNMKSNVGIYWTQVFAASR